MLRTPLIKEHNRNVHASAGGRDGALTDAIEIGLIELAEIKLGLAVQSRAWTCACPGQWAIGGFVVRIPGMLDHPKANEIMIHALQPIQIAGEVPARQGVGRRYVLDVVPGV